VQVIETGDDGDYNVTYRTREAWSGDNRQWRGSIPPRRTVGRRSMPPGQQQSRGGEVLEEDWEFTENTLPVQYQQHGDTRLEDVGARWQMMQQQQPVQFHQTEQPRRHVAYVGHPHPGDEDFVRHPGEFEHYAPASGPVDYDQGHVRQRSPTRSLPVVPSDFHTDSTKPQRFYKYAVNRYNVIFIQFFLLNLISLDLQILGQTRLKSCNWIMMEMKVKKC
jgi:hypothetical protein